MSFSMRSLAQLLLPSRMFRRIADARRRARYDGLSTKEAFEKIYDEGYWGRDAEGNPISGSGSHDEKVVAPYVATVRRFLQQLGKPTVADLGCGDFNIGSQLSDSAATYLACDISEKILEINRHKFNQHNVQFQQLDLGRDVLPRADVCLVRQVLQHLSNDEIARFVAQLNERMPFGHLIVTEHVATGVTVEPNLDKPSGPGVRVENRSGVDLTAAPFGLHHFGATLLLEVRQDSGGIAASIRTIAYRLSDVSTA